MSYKIGDIQEVRSDAPSDAANALPVDPRHQNRRIPVVGPIAVTPLKQRGAWAPPKSRRPDYVVPAREYGEGMEAADVGIDLGAYDYQSYRIGAGLTATMSRVSTTATTTSGAALTAATTSGGSKTVTMTAPQAEAAQMLNDAANGRNVLSRVDDKFAALLRDTPNAHAIIDALPQPMVPAYYPNFKQDLKARPLSALLNLQKPIENLVKDTIRNAISIGGSTADVFNIAPPGAPAFMVRMGIDPPPEVKDPTGRESATRMLMLQNFLILAWLRPDLLAVGFVKTLVDEFGRAKTAAEKAKVLDKAVALLNMVRSSGFSLGGTDKPGQKFVTALANEIKSKFPDLSFFRDITQAAQDTQNVVAFWSDYIRLMAGELGLDTGYTKRWQLACIRIEKDKTDSGVRWEIDNVAGVRPEQNDGQNAPASLRGLQRRGDALNWPATHPVFNPNFRNLLDDAKRELDWCRHTICDPGELYQFDYKDNGRRSYTFEGGPKLPFGGTNFNHKNLWKVATVKDPPSKVLSGDAFSNAVMNILRQTGAVGPVKNSLADRIAARLSQGADLISGAGIPGVSNAVSFITDKLGFPALSLPNNPSFPALGSFGLAGTQLIPVGNFRIGQTVVGEGSAGAGAGGGGSMAIVTSLCESLAPVVIPMVVQIAMSLIMAMTGAGGSPAEVIAAAENAKNALSNAKKAKRDADTAKRDADTAKLAADQASQQANAARTSAAGPNLSRPQAEVIATQAAQTKQSANAAKATADAQATAAQTSSEAAAKAADDAQAAANKAQDAANRVAQTEMMTQLATRSALAATSAAMQGVSVLGQWYVGQANTGAGGAGAGGTSAGMQQAKAALDEAKAAAKEATTIADDTAAQANTVKQTAAQVTQTTQATQTTLDSITAWWEQNWKAAAAGSAAGLAVVGLGVAAFLLMNKKKKK